MIIVIAVVSVARYVIVSDAKVASLVWISIVFNAHFCVNHLTWRVEWVGGGGEYHPMSPGYSSPAATPPSECDDGSNAEKMFTSFGLWLNYWDFKLNLTLAFSHNFHETSKNLANHYCHFYFSSLPCRLHQLKYFKCFCKLALLLLRFFCVKIPQVEGFSQLVLDVIKN